MLKMCEIYDLMQHGFISLSWCTSCTRDEQSMPRSLWFSLDLLISTSLRQHWRIPSSSSHSKHFFPSLSSIAHTRHLKLYSLARFSYHKSCTSEQDIQGGFFNRKIVLLTHDSPQSQKLRSSVLYSFARTPLRSFVYFFFCNKTALVPIKL